LKEIRRDPLPGLSRWKQRLILRSVLTIFRRDVVGIHGLDKLDPARDPVILALNHSTRIEAILIPILFAFARRGQLVSFIADWNFALIPGVATILREGEVILLARKKARPAFLNVFKPLFERKGPAFERAARALASGRSIGIFPEGTTNRHPTQLLRGYEGVARLSLTTGRPVIPIGVRFPGQPPDRPIRDRSPMEIFVGDPLRPPDPVSEPTRGLLRAWHEQIMREISRLSGKQWNAGATRKKHHGLE
jgi:1-acyl-sn-glycerol-3-phosphate acyltransferase